VGGWFNHRTLSKTEEIDMKPMAFVFPGVGSQHVGMGKEFYENFKCVRDTFEEASDVLKIDLTKMCFLPQKEVDLARLENSQVALFTVCVSTFRVFMEEIGNPPQYCIGHSLGEYSALCCAGVIKFSDALVIVKKRGEILEKVAADKKGIIAWVINLDNQIVEKICTKSIKEGEHVYVSAYDTPKQSSISGSTVSVMKIGKKLEKEGAIVYPLKLSGPFHCPLMKPAGDELKEILEQYEFNKSLYPVIANHHAMCYLDKDSVISNLSLQLSKPIRWQTSIEYLLRQGVELAFELGPDRVLKHLIKNNTDLIRTFSLGNMNDLKTIKQVNCN
jgi:[acyl-carrier-protein] S-malonyltransferase